MKRKAVFIVIAIAVALAALLVATTALAKRLPLTQQVVGWRLTGVRVTNPGQVIAMDEGQFIQGLVLEATATWPGNELVAEGTFRLTYDVFTPSRDLLAQKAGANYVQGSWTITRKGASLESAAARHSPDVVSGTIQAELSFNPALVERNWSALATLPMSPAAGRWAKGKGSFSLDGRGGGELLLGTIQWPEIQ